MLMLILILILILIFHTSDPPRVSGAPRDDEHTDQKGWAFCAAVHHRLQYEYPVYCTSSVTRTCTSIYSYDINCTGDTFVLVLLVSKCRDLVSVERRNISKLQSSLKSRLQSIIQADSRLPYLSVEIKDVVDRQNLDKLRDRSNRSSFKGRDSSHWVQFVIYW